MKKFLCLTLSILMLFLSSACTGGREDTKTINVYFKNSETNALVPEAVKCKKELDVHDTAVFAIEKLVEGPKEEVNLAVIPDGARINTISIENDTATVDFSKQFANAEGIDEIMARFAVVSTLCDIEGIDSVYITVGGEDLVSNSTGKKIGRLSKSDIVYESGIGSQEEQDTTLVKLYFANSDATGLEAETRRVVTENSISTEKTIITELLKGPGSPELMAIIPAETKLLNLETKNGVCFVNFSSEFVSKFAGGTNTGMLIVYSIVNSLTELENIESVQILIEGKTGAEFGDFVFDEPIEANMSIVIS